MIPKKIHYCWLSGEAIPANLQRCMDSWRRVMPDCEVVRWDTSTFDVDSNVFVAEAFRKRKWAFATDYIRLHALHAQGGIYLDTDVLVRRRFDEFLTSDFFSSVEYHHKLVRQLGTRDLLHPDGSSIQQRTPKPGIGLQAAVLGAVQGHPFLERCLAFYRDRNFILPDGSYFDQVIAPDVYAMVAEEFGFRYQDERQQLRANMLILPSEIFAGGEDQYTARSYAVHFCAGSWREQAHAGVLERLLRKAYWTSGLKRMVDMRLDARSRATAKPPA